MPCNNLTRMLMACLFITAPMLSAANGDVAQTFRQLFTTGAQVPHPAIVQIWAPDREAISRGSGTLIHVDGQFGYVITNWHVVRDAEREVAVIFPDGHQSLARILKMNKDWDLALLLVWAGREQPMPLAAMGPRPGDMLTIAGYGSGDFRAQSGKFSTFAAPNPDMPFEMFEVSVAARQGDSGGPITNQRGELVGVLFGAGDGLTTGTQIGRVRMFVNEAFAELREQAEVLARQGPPAQQQHDRSQGAQQLAALPPQQYTGRDTVRSTGPSVDVDQPNAVAILSPQEVLDPRVIGPPPFQSELDAQPQTLDSQLLPTGSNGSESGLAANSSSAVSIPTDVPRPVTTPNHRESTLADSRDAWQQYADESTPQDAQYNRPLQGETVASAPPRHAVEVSRRDLYSADKSAEREPMVAASSPDLTPLSSDRAVVPTSSVSPVPNMLPNGVTWEQIRSFFAAVGVFAVLHTIAKVFAVSPAKKKSK